MNISRESPICTKKPHIKMKFRGLAPEGGRRETHRLSSPACIPDDSYLQDFETFDDLISQTTLRESQLSGATSPNDCSESTMGLKQTAPGVGRLIQLLGRDLASSGALENFGCGLNQASMFPNCLVTKLPETTGQVKHDSGKRDAGMEYDLANTVSFYTAGRKMLVRPSKASLEFALCLMNDNSDDFNNIANSQNVVSNQKFCLSQNSRGTSSHRAAGVDGQRKENNWSLDQPRDPQTVLTNLHPAALPCGVSDKRTAHNNHQKHRNEPAGPRQQYLDVPDNSRVGPEGSGSQAKASETLLFEELHSHAGPKDKLDKIYGPQPPWTRFYGPTKVSEREEKASAEEYVFSKTETNAKTLGRAKAYLPSRNPWNKNNAGSNADQQSETFDARAKTKRQRLHSTASKKDLLHPLAEDKLAVKQVKHELETTDLQEHFPTEKVCQVFSTSTPVTPSSCVHRFWANLNIKDISKKLLHKITLAQSAAVTSEIASSTPFSTCCNYFYRVKMSTKATAACGVNHIFTLLSCAYFDAAFPGISFNIEHMFRAFSDFLPTVSLDSVRQQFILVTSFFIREKQNPKMIAVIRRVLRRLQRCSLMEVTDCCRLNVHPGWINPSTVHQMAKDSVTAWRPVQLMVIGYMGYLLNTRRFWFSVTDGKTLALLGVTADISNRLEFGCLIRLIGAELYQIKLLTSLWDCQASAALELFFSCAFVAHLGCLYVQRGYHHTQKQLVPLGFLDQVPVVPLQELDAVSETDEQDLLTMTETRLLVIDAQYLGFLVSDWLSASSSEVNVLSSPVALFRRIKQNCAFLIAPQITASEYETIGVGQPLLLTNVIIQKKASQPTSESHHSLPVIKGKLSERLDSKINVKELVPLKTNELWSTLIATWKTKMSEDIGETATCYRSSDEKKRGYLAYLQALFPVTGYSLLNGLPLVRCLCLNDTERVSEPAQLGVFPGWPYNVQGLALFAQFIASTLEIFILTKSGLVMICIKFPDYAIKGAAERMQELIKSCSHEREDVLVANVSLQSLQPLGKQISTWTVRYKKRGYPELCSAAAELQEEKDIRALDLWIFHSSYPGIMMKKLKSYDGVSAAARPSEAVTRSWINVIQRVRQGTSTRSVLDIILRWRDVKRRLIISDLRCTFSEWSPLLGFHYSCYVMVRRCINFGGDDSESIRRGLMELGIAARSALVKQQEVMEVDMKRLNYQSFLNEDQALSSAFKCLEAEIAALQVDLSYWKRESNGGPFSGVSRAKIGNAQLATAPRSLVPGTSAVGSDGATLWAALEQKYDSLLKTLVDDTVEDAMRITISELWDEELSDWDTCVAEFEQSLENQAWDAAFARRDGGVARGYPPGKDATSNFLDAPVKASADGSRNDAIEMSNTISANQRLLINQMSRPPLLPTRGADVLAELVKLSCSSLPLSSTVQDACMEIWEIIISLCGLESKRCFPELPEANVKHLRQVVYNALRSLQDFCRKQIFRQLRIAAEEDLSGPALLERLKMFCSLEDPVGSQSEALQLWQLTYWCYRCGSPDALHALLEALEHRAASGATTQLPPAELRLLLLALELLYDRLKTYSRGRAADADAVWMQTSGQPSSRVHFAGESGVLKDPALVESFFDLFHQHEAFNANPIVALLASILHPNGLSIGLKTVMPNATAEDFLWYNLSLLEDKHASRLVQGIAKLQNRIIQLGPSHFGSTSRGSQINLAFAKIAFLALAPTTAIDWASQAYLELTGICLQWLVYLAQCDLIGSEKSSLLASMFPALSDFLGSTSLLSAFEELLMPNGKLSVMPIGVALQWCELLPRSLRIALVGSMLQAGTSELLDDRVQMAWVLGSIEDDGSCRGGILYRCLMAPSWLDDSSDVERRESRSAGHKAFETLIAGLAEAAAQQNKLIQAVALSYLISQDRVAMKFLLHLFASPNVFPPITEAALRRDSSRRIAAETTEEQAEVWKFFTIFKERLACEELQELAPAFELLYWASLAAECYVEAHRGNINACWKRLTQDIQALSFPSKNASASSLQEGHQFALFPDIRLVAVWKNTDLVPHLPRLVEVATLCLDTFSRNKQEMLDVKELRKRATALLNTTQELSEWKLTINPAFVEALRSVVSLTRV